MTKPAIGTASSHQKPDRQAAQSEPFEKLNPHGGVNIETHFSHHQVN